MSVALIVGGFPTAAQPEKNIFNLRAARALSREVDVHVVVLRAWKPSRRLRVTETLDDFRVTTVAVPQLPRAAVINLVMYQRLGWPLVKRVIEAVDVVHSVDAAGVGLIAAPWARRSGSPHVTQVTQTMTRESTPHLYEGRFREWYRGADAIVCNGRALSEQLAKLDSLTPKIEIVYRGVDTTLYRPDGLLDERLPSTPAVRFLYAGGFPDYPTLPYGANTKGGLTLFEAWRIAEEELFEAEASLVLCGPSSRRTEVMSWHRSLRHPQAVQILGDVEPTAMPALLRSVAAVLVPSLQEGLPNIAMEAAATGRAVIASDIAPMREVVVHDKSGVLVSAGDARAWADALKSLSRNRTRLAELGAAGRLRAESLFDARNYAPKMAAIYRAVRGVTPEDEERP